MKSIVPIIVLVGVVAVASAGGLYYYLRIAAPAVNQPSLCSDPNSISSHVYNPYRLQQVKPCITVSGVVEYKIEEADGDYHLRLALDSQYSNLTNAANDQEQYGDLVVEVICALPISQQDAVLACEGYTNTITIPSVNDHITVTGPYVLDTYHDNWAEIHPVYSLVIG